MVKLKNNAYSRIRTTQKIIIFTKETNLSSQEIKILGCIYFKIFK